MSAISMRLLVYAVLLALLGVSVATSLAFGLGAVRIATHLIIALVQATLVYVIFMQLHAAAPTVKLIAVGVILWIAIMFGFSLLDYGHRQIGTAGGA